MLFLSLLCAIRCGVNVSRVHNQRTDVRLTSSIFPGMISSIVNNKFNIYSFTPIPHIHPQCITQTWLVPASSACKRVGLVAVQEQQPYTTCAGLVPHTACAGLEAVHKDLIAIASSIRNHKTRDGCVDVRAGDEKRPVVRVCLHNRVVRAFTL